MSIYFPVESNNSVTDLIEQVGRDEEVIVTRSGKPALRVVAVKDEVSTPQKFDLAWLQRVRVIPKKSAQMPSDILTEIRDEYR
jgi:prevent-host-death family protein